MAANSDDLLISISTDLTAVRRQLKQLGTDIGTATSGIQKQFDGMGKSIDASMTPIQKRINAMMGIPVASKVKEWKGALADTGHAAEGVSTSMQAMMHATRSMAEQLALGVSPAQALTGQLSHLSYVATQPGGITGAFKEIGAKAMAMITAFPEVAVAIGVAAAAFIAYETLGGNNIKTLDEILKTHEANIKRLGDAYDEVAGKQHKYASDTANTVNALNEGSAKDIKATLGAQLKGVFDDLYKQIGAGGGNQGALQTVLISQFEPFQAAIEKLAEGARSGAPDVKAFRDEVTELAKADPKNLDSTRDVLLGLTSAAADTAASLPAVTQAVSAVVDTVTQFQQMVDSISSKPLQKELEDLFAKAKDGTESLDEINQALATLEQANPNFSSIIAAIGNIVIAARNASDAVNSMYAASGNGNGRHESAQRVPDGVVVPTPTDAPNREDQGALEDKLAAKAARGSKTKAPAKTAADQFTGDLQAIKDRGAALMEEVAAMGLTYEQQVKRQTSLQLEQTALKQVREEARKKGDVDWQNAQLTPDMIKKIDEQSAAFAHQSEILKELQAAQQLQRDVLQSVFDDLKTSLEAGQLSWKTFGTIAMDVLDKIISKIETDLIDSIMQANNAGGGGSIFGSILGLLTGSGGSSFGTPGGFAQMLGIPGYANGTDNHPGGLAIVGENGPELLNLPRGSKVTPRVPTMPAIMSGGGGSGSYNDNRQITIDARGAQQGVGEQIKAALTEYDRHSVPRTIAAIRTAKQRGMA